MERFHQEAEYLVKWSTMDIAELMSVGFNRRFVEDLPRRIGASRQTQEDWLESRFTHRGAVVEWIQISRIASDFRERLLSAFLYAYRHNKELLPRIREIAKGDEDVTMLADFEKLVALSKNYPKPLAAVHFNFLQLDDVEFLADKMHEILARASKESFLGEGKKKFRDAAYTHLKEAVDEIRAAGRYVFRRNAERLRGYLGTLVFQFGDDRVEDKTFRYTADHLSKMW
jgi:hypothetical protein